MLGFQQQQQERCRRRHLRNGWGNPASLHPPCCLCLQVGGQQRRQQRRHVGRKVVHHLDRRKQKPNGVSQSAGSSAASVVQDPAPRKQKREASLDETEHAKRPRTVTLQSRAETFLRQLETADERAFGGVAGSWLTHKKDVVSTIDGLPLNVASYHEDRLTALECMLRTLHSALL